MPLLDQVVALYLNHGVTIAVSVAVFLVSDLLLRAVMRRREEAGAINTRLRVRAATGDAKETLSQLRLRRGLDAEGNYLASFTLLNRLVMQSGVAIRPGALVAVMVLAGSAAGIVSYLATQIFLFGFAAALGGVGLPVLWLAWRRKKRLAHIEEQLPEAIDIVVRSLKAGHPVRVAISLVARELPDPIGSEFGMCFDEMTYGLDLETAMGNMRVRTGQTDLALVVIAISVQARSGGNLAEILGNLSRLIRERAKMRRKIHALSAEGRFSAIALSVIPLLLWAVITMRAPSYFSDVKSDPLFMPAVYLGFTLWATGVFVMRRMVNFKV